MISLYLDPRSRRPQGLNSAVRQAAATSIRADLLWFHGIDFQVGGETSPASRAGRSTADIIGNIPIPASPNWARHEA
jgi:hypothetical protein